MFRTRRGRAALAAAITAVTALAAPAGAGVGKGRLDEPVTVVADGLSGPFGLKFAAGDLLVTEAFAAQVTRVDPRTGEKTPVVTGLPGASAADQVGSRIVAVTGADEQPFPGDASVFVTEKKGSPTLLADLEAFELAHNPDQQLQFDPATGAPLDALSNPFSVLAQRGQGYVLVADGGGNDVLSVSRTGEVSAFFVPPTVDTGACAGLPNNDPAHPGCDSVPTGLAYGPGNTLYISALTGEVPGEGRVYIVDARTGELEGVLTGFSGPTGVAVAPNGTVYVSEIFAENPAGPPGRIVRVAPDGTRTYAWVPMPVGLDYHGGVLYSTAWALGDPGTGQVVAVLDRAFA